MYQVRILKAATKELAHLDPLLGRRIVDRIKWQASRMDEVRLKALTGHMAGLYKLRIGDYRVIYEAIHSEQCLVIHAIRHRREVYRKP